MNVGTICLGLFAASCLTGLAIFVVAVELSARRMKKLVVPTVPADEEQAA